MAVSKGKVIKSTGSWYDILGEDGQMYEGRLRGKLRMKGLKVTNPVAVGDEVLITEEEGEGNRVLIHDIAPRENYIIRKATQKAHHGHILAANIDQAVLVATMTMPRTSQGFIDRFLVTAETFRIPATIVFNKADLLDAQLKEDQDFLRWMYEGIGYTVLYTSAQEGDGIDDFKAHLNGKVSLLSGHSGVGKSTLLNTIAPEVAQKIGEVSQSVKKGKHTTTFAEMFQIWESTFLIDTPGIKELGLMEVGDEELAHYFPEMRERMQDCRFHNCQHTHEPGCAIKAAVEDNEIDFRRYESYLSILHEDDNRR